MKYPILLATAAGLIFSTTAFVATTKADPPYQSEAEYKYYTALADLKVTEERALSTFIRNTDDPNNLPDDSVLQLRKDTAIAEKQAFLRALATPHINHDRINTNESYISANKTAIKENTAAIANNTNRITALEDDVENLKGGVAMAIAIANAPIISNGDNKFSLSGGVGYYEDAFALSLKSAFMPTNNVAITASVASDMGNNFAVGAGIGIGF